MTRHMLLTLRKFARELQADIERRKGALSTLKSLITEEGGVVAPDDEDDSTAEDAPRFIPRRKRPYKRTWTAAQRREQGRKIRAYWASRRAQRRAVRVTRKHR